MGHSLSCLLALCLFILGCQSSPVRAPTGAEGTEGNAGALGQGGSSGQSGGGNYNDMYKMMKPSSHYHIAIGFNDLPTLAKWLAEGHSVNKAASPSHGTPFQEAIERRNHSALDMIVNNTTDKPNLRQKLKPSYCTDFKPEKNKDIMEVSAYELILYARKIPGAHYDDIGLCRRDNFNKMLAKETELYIDPDQLRQLEIVLSMETDPAALRAETDKIVKILKVSEYTTRGQGAPTNKKTLSNIDQRIRQLEAK